MKILYCFLILLFVRFSGFSQTDTLDLGKITKSKLGEIKSVNQLVKDLPIEFRTITTELNLKGNDRIGVTSFKGLKLDEPALRVLKVANESSVIYWSIVVDGNEKERRVYRLLVQGN